MKFFLAIAGLVVTTLSSAVLATQPVQTTATFDGIGGDSVTGSGEWSMVVNTTACEIEAYRLNYETMSWDFSQTVIIPPGLFTAFFCDASEFGASVSIAGDVMVVGAPGFNPTALFCIFGNSDDRGAFLLFELVNGSWEAQTIGNSCSNLVYNVGAAPGDRTGDSISITRLEGTTDGYVIAVGAPRSNNGFVEEGTVYTYGYDASTNMLNPGPVVDGGSANTQLGFSVTTNDRYVLAGGIFGNGGAGLAKFFEVSGGAAINQVDLVAPGSTALGAEVSLSDDFALVSSVFDAYAWENTAAPGATPVWSLGSNQFLANGGDVSQSRAISSFGDLQGGMQGATIYRDPINDDVVNDAIIADVAGDYAGDTLDAAGRDIRLVSEYLWFANPGEDRAILYTHPCGYGTKLETAVYKLISLPCEIPGTTTIGDVFGGLGVGDKNVARIFYYDKTIQASSDPAVEIQPGDVGLTFDALGINATDYAFWVIVATEQYFAVPASLTTAAFTTSDPTIFQPSSVKRMRELALPFPVDPDTGVSDGGGNDFARVMVSNPFPRSFDWSELYWRQSDSPTTGLEGPVSAPGGRMLANGYVYDPDSTAGQPYRAVVVGTPGLDETNTIEPYQGFWVRVLEGAGSTYPVSLLLPQSE